ncbi:hypothetical protein [Amycolatopsis magusensis]|uniref:hypothetical protein n=1 Tax=Amycolatopsis magusensis TaxID=882444 RepID=UPI0037899421
MTSEGVRRCWSEFLDRAETGQVVIVSRRGRTKLAAVPWPRYVEHHAATDTAVSEPVRVSAADDGDAQPIWWTASLVVVESGVAKDAWRRLQVWVEAGGHAIVERYGCRLAVLTPVSWAQNLAAADAAGEAAPGGPAD